MIILFIKIITTFKEGESIKIQILLKKRKKTI